MPVNIADIQKDITAAARSQFSFSQNQQALLENRMVEPPQKTDVNIENLLEPMPEGFECAEEHDAYIRHEVQKALDDKAKLGDQAYESFDEIRKKFERDD